MEDNIEVSICCAAYNHEKYICDALNSFLMQKTNFKYEILIHDDASTDNTASIIREYEKEYSNIIKPIYQTENQYSKGIRISQTFNYPRAKGKYIAICEGDDFWTDENKLQKQYDFMESHRDYSMCCHNAKKVDIDGIFIKNIDAILEEKEMTPNEVINEPNGWIATASIFVRKEVACSMPNFTTDLPIGDYPLRLHCLAMGKVYYFNQIMSAYRVSTKEKKKSDSYIYNRDQNNDLLINERIKLNKYLLKYNEFSKKKYENLIYGRIDRNEFLIGVYENNIKKLKKTRMYQCLSLKGKISYYILLKYPSLHKQIQKVFRFIFKKIKGKNHVGK